ncbi:MAG: DNA primase [Candidatus Hydrogenedentes bacterium]|nr:DNA primase [Candidatus Hydrogenedentota bacterium]
MSATDIVEIVGSFLELRPSGNGRYVALCPFHNEKTPSFHVSRDRQNFYCFGCEKGGDAIGFIREMEGLSFIESLRKLADRAGIQLPAMTEREGQDEYLRSRLIELGALAARFYSETLRDPLKGGKARQYLKTRTLADATVKKFGLGYAPDGYSSFLDAAKAEKFRERELDASGLVKRGERGGYYDTFRSRLMVPIRDVSGNIVAFGGRDLTGASPAKYINSPETVLYKKSRVLYGLHEARDALRKEKQAILVEGYFDLMRCFDAGICNVVATCGTALTTEQAALIRRYVPEVVVVYDGDAAGVRAALRGVAILTAAGLTVRALVLPGGKDPDDYIRDAGADAFRALVDSSLDFVTFYIRMNAERLGSIEGRTDVAKEVFTIVQGVDDLMRVDEYLKRAAHELDLDEWRLKREFEAQLRGRGTPAQAPAEEKPATKRVSQDDRDFLSVLLHSEPMRERAEKELKGIALKPGPFAEVLTAILASVQERFDDEAAASLYAAASNRHETTADQAEVLVSRRIVSLKREALLLEEHDLEEAIRQAKRQNDTARETELVMRRIGIRKEIDGLGAA